MVIIKRDDIVAYWVDEKIVCAYCVTMEEINEAGADDIRVEADFADSDDLVFCDRQDSDVCRERNGRIA